MVQQLFDDSVRYVIVEDVADLVYLSEMSKRLRFKRRPSLAADLAFVPIGGADQVPALVALLSGQPNARLTFLLNGEPTSSHVRDVKALIDHARVGKVRVVLCSEILERDGGADLEDLFHVDDYLRLCNWMDRGANLTSQDLPVDSQRILRRVASALGHPIDRRGPASQLSAHREEFLNTVKPESLIRFDVLFKRLNSTLP
jgi:hypothetical protein